MSVHTSPHRTDSQRSGSFSTSSADTVDGPSSTSMKIYGLQQPGRGNIPYEKRTRILRIKVLNASSLAKKDIFGTSDPYVQIKLMENGQNASNYCIGTANTKTKKNTLNPEWKEEFLFRVDPCKHKVIMEVFDENRLTRDDFLGFVEIGIGNIKTEGPAQTIEPKHLTLRPRSSRSHVKGGLTVVLSYVRTEGWTGPLDEPTSDEDYDVINNAEAADAVSVTSATSSRIAGSASGSGSGGGHRHGGGGEGGSGGERPPPLPVGWEERQDFNGRVYYVNHDLRTTQWDRPTVGDSSAQSASDLRNARNQYLQRLVSSDSTVPSTAPTLSSASGSGSDSTGGDDGIFTPQMSRNGSFSTVQTGGNNLPSDIDPLPAGWDYRVSSNGRMFFIDHNTRLTTWVDPRTSRPSPLPTAPVAAVSHVVDSGAGKANRKNTVDILGPLPEGWEERVHTDGRTFYIDHAGKRTQWDDPRLNNPDIAGQAVPYSRDYKRKYEYFRSELRIPPHLPNKFDIKVKRSHILEDSYRAVMTCPKADLLKTKLWIEFDGEVGLDYGGVSREWFFLLSREMFNPYYGLFEYSAGDNYTLQINPKSGLCNDDHLSYFKFVGRVAGMAVFHGKLLDAFFIRPFYKMMLEKPITLKDMESVDLEYYNSLQWILDNDPADLDLRFTVDEEVYGVMQQAEIKPGGSSIPVTQENKREYIDLVIKWRFVDRVEHQMHAFMTGFAELIPKRQLQIFDPNEVELLLSGIANIDVKDWKYNAIYKGEYHGEHLVIQWFWKAILSFDNELRARLLQFVTGTSRVPMNGFSELQGSNGPQKFCIEKWGTEKDFPRAHTCFNRLDLPPYSNYDLVRERLIQAMENTEGFGGVD
ncbi:E3 ubiquitin-protein ligase Nedd-4 [Hypsibius exemplaris]|uniref:E3 ubiquitin-protein ligase n=1 Tax=Hypsibius exemplaris TaxID=2072580 RepID=A0A9X6NC50_HYPEX|nr:E3 ubiquitin-protein ligase Nedd-4 [Hypsibius exemplaris]